MGPLVTSILCPVCRQRTAKANVHSVTCSTERVDSDDSVPEVEGSHSTKIRAVIEKLHLIAYRYPGEKSIVFSAWSDVLGILSAALTQNNLEHSSLHNVGGVKFQKQLQSFKASPTCNILLMPLSSGSKGLNVVEASHVILVEPILQPAVEQQTIGRVHRIGQKRRSFVHRFVVRQTIEDKLHRLLGDRKGGESRMALDDVPLTIADIAELFMA